MTDMDNELDLALEKQKDRERDAQIEGKMFSDLDFCAEQAGAFEALEEITDVVRRVNCYGHEISVKEFVEKFL